MCCFDFYLEPCARISGYEPPLIAVPALTLLLLNSPCHLGSSGV